DYVAVVSNASGTVTSRVARLTVIDPLIITQPTSQNREPGESVTFSIAALGTPPLSYQWMKDEKPLPQGREPVLTFTNLQKADAGLYAAVVGTKYGSMTSTVVALSLNCAPVDSGFNPGANDIVLSQAVQTDGKTVVGGAFTYLGGQPCNRIGRLNPDGSLDTAFNPGADATVYSLAIQLDKKILVGGDFVKIGGQTRRAIARLHPDGTVDTDFTAIPFALPDPPQNLSVSTRAILIQPDGKILVGGRSATLAFLRRLNTNGSSDNGFRPSGITSVNAMALQSDGKILIGGNGSLVRLNPDGSVDSTFIRPVGGLFNVFTLAVQPDGKILVGGQITTLGGKPCLNIARLGPNGRLDESFPASVTGTNATWTFVRSLALQANGKILVGGSYKGLSSATRSNFGRLNPDGTVDPSFDVETDGMNYSYVSSVVVDTEGRILVGGTFRTLDGQSRSCIGRVKNTEPSTERLTTSTSAATWLRGGAGPEIWRATFEISTNLADWTYLGEGLRVPGGWEMAGIALPADARIRVRGYTTSDGCSSWFLETISGPCFFAAQPFGRTNNAGTVAEFSPRVQGTPPLSYQWLKNGIPLRESDLISGTQTGILSLGFVLGSDSGGYSVIVSNSYGSVTSMVATLQVLDPVIVSSYRTNCANAGDTVTLEASVIGTTPWTCQWLKDGVSISGATSESLVLTDLHRADLATYSLVACSGFGMTISNQVLLEVNLATADSFAPLVEHTTYGWWEVDALAEQRDGKILLEGTFTKLDGQVREGIARVTQDGVLDFAFRPGSNAGAPCMLVQADGKILSGFLKRFLPDGSVDTSFSCTTDGIVYAMVEQPDGKILVCGRFQSLAGRPRAYLGRLNHDGSLDESFAPQLGGDITSMAIQPDGKILIAGDLIVNSCGQSVARFHQDGSVDTSFGHPDAGYLIDCMALQSDGKILIGGKSGLSPRRLNPDGTFDSAFAPKLGSYPGPALNSLVVQADGKIIAGGEFSTVGGKQRINLVRLNPDGSADPTFNVPVRR
ncbi:MAG TPA: immunoglobulin domain-containing protein, partial [Clostridia bacterium]|nr:immunoglobulin domain-containing protein [Clostridia bacterium]